MLALSFGPIKSNGGSRLEVGVCGELEQETKCLTHGSSIPFLRDKLASMLFAGLR